MRPLEDNSGIGVSLSSIIDFGPNYRYRVCGNHFTFYYVENHDVFVVRVLYGRQDYMRILFGESQE